MRARAVEVLRVRPAELLNVPNDSLAVVQLVDAGDRDLEACERQQPVRFDALRCQLTST